MDTTALKIQFSAQSGIDAKVRGIPHLARHPSLVGKKEFVTLRIPMITCSALRVRPVTSGLLVFDTTVPEEARSHRAYL